MKMATSMELTTNIESVYTIAPREVTDPQISYKISVSNNKSLDNDHDHGVLLKAMHILLCFKKPSTNEDYGSNVGLWFFKESLGKAVLECPILAGRLRRTEDDDGGLEIVSNDSGIRCVDAHIPLSMVEFLELSKEMKSEIEGKLFYWKDVEKTNPSSSPLFYIQVTKFQCGGHSMGISCSLLLTDPSYMAKFLNKWAEIHRNLFYDSEGRRTPLSIYTSNINIGCSKVEYGTIHTSKDTSTKTSKTMIFNISTEDKLNDEICKYFMQICLEEAESKNGSTMSSTFTLIIKKPNGNAKVEVVSKQANFASTKNLIYELDSLSWEDLGINEVAFQRECGLIDASNWIDCDALEGVVMAVISNVSENTTGIKVFITFPNDQD